MKRILTIACLFAFVAAAGLTGGCYSCPCAKKDGAKIQQRGDAEKQGPRSEQGDRQGPPPQFEGR